MIFSFSLSHVPWPLTAIVFGVVVSLVPGPILVLAISHTLEKQIWSAIQCIIGLLIGEIFYIALILMGYHLYLIKYPHLFNILSTLGGVFIIIVGIKNIFSNTNTVINSTVSLKSNYIIKSLFITLLNPAIILILLSAMGLYNKSYSSYPIPIAFFIFIEIGSILYYSFIIFIFYRLSAAVNQQKIGYAKNITGILLIILGLAILI